MYQYRIGYIFNGESILVSAMLFLVSIGIDIADTYLKYRLQPDY